MDTSLIAETLNTDPKIIEAIEELTQSVIADADSSARQFWANGQNELYNAETVSAFIAARYPECRGETLCWGIETLKVEL